MPFLARCPFCHKEMRAAQSLAGRSVACKYCGDAFTLAPCEELPRAPGRAEPLNPAPLPTPAVLDPLADSPLAATPVDLPTPMPAMRLGDPVKKSPTLDLGKPSPPARPKSFSTPPLGALSLFLSGVALILLSFPGIRWITLALCVGGLICGVGGWLTADASNRKQAWLAVVGGALSLPILVIAGFYPRSLAVRPVADLKLPEEDPAKILAVPVGGVAIEPTVEWIDAGNYSIQQADLRVRIRNVVIAPVEFTNKKIPLAQRPYLQIHLEIMNVRARKPLTYRSWSGADGLSLRDGSANPLPQPTFERGAEIVGRKSTETLGPFARTTDVLVFDVPPAAKLDRLRLELPAAQAGGIGMLKFEIPSTMIQRRTLDRRQP